MKQKATKEPIKNEANNGLKNTRGTLAMARTQAPHSATAQLVYFGIKKLKKGRGSSWLRDLIYWYMPTALLRGIFHNVPDSCFRQWIK